MMEKFSVEEINLMCIYDVSSRAALLADLRAGLLDVYDPDMRTIFDSAIEKLEGISDEDFADISFFIADDFMGDDFSAEEV